MHICQGKGLRFNSILISVSVYNVIVAHFIITSILMYVNNIFVV